MRVYLVAGSPEARPPAGAAPGPGDRVIAVDRGYLHARAWGWPVDVLVGDLDSLAEALAEAGGAPGVRPGQDGRQVRAALGLPQETELITAPAAKDDTDLELGLARALRDAAPDADIILCAALGGRTDHLLGNLFLLARPELQGRQAWIADGATRVRLLRGGAALELDGPPGSLVSLVPAGSAAVGVSTAGLLYPLRDETLPLGRARGISNVVEAAGARVALRRGLLFVIEMRGA